MFLLNPKISIIKPLFSPWNRRCNDSNQKVKQGVIGAGGVFLKFQSRDFEANSSNYKQQTQTEIKRGVVKIVYIWEIKSHSCKTDILVSGNAKEHLL